MKSETGKKHVKQADSDEKTALILAAQLTSARKWRNSTNNQVTDALKSVPSPVSEDELQKLRAKDTSYTDANNVYQNASGASNGISAQADYYRNAGVDISKVSALDSGRKNLDYNGDSYNGAYQGNSTSYASPDVPQIQSSPPNSSEQGVNNGTSDPSSYYAQPTGDPYSNYSYQTATHNDGYSSEAAGNSSDPRGSDSRVSNTAESNAVGYNTVGYNTTESNTGGYPYTGESNTGTSYTGESNTEGTNTGASSTGQSNTGASNTGASNQYNSYYGEANNPSATSAYSSSYGQQSTSKDTTDNTVPNGIENQTSYEMNPDASTAQYGNNQPANT